MNYYVCVLTTGERLDFGKEAVDIEWSSDMCQVKDKENTTIGVIPMINIQYFKLVKKEG